MGSAAAGERGLGQGPPPLTAGKNPKLSHYYVPVFSEHTTHNTHTFVLGSVAMATLFRIIVLQLCLTSGSCVGVPPSPPICPLP